MHVRVALFNAEILNDLFVLALGHDKAQSIIDQITASYESTGGPPPGGFGFGPQHLGGPPPGFGLPPPGFGGPMPPPGFNGTYLTYAACALFKVKCEGRPPFPPGPGFPPMMPPGAPPFPPNGMPPPGMPPNAFPPGELEL